MTLTLKNLTGKIRETYHATVSDIHANHPRIPTVWIMRSLDKAFPDNSDTAQLDYIWFAGDLFDRIAQLPQAEVSLLHGWFRLFLSRCRRNGTRVRILEGTPSHDRKQAQLIVDINTSLGKEGCDLKYIDTLMVDYEPDFDFHVLYVPDEWHPDPKQTWDDVQTQLRLHGIDKVQIGIMHGYMDFQTGGNHYIHNAHCSADYSDIVDWFVSIGHVHTRSFFRNIYAQGSLDRLCQGEEEDKGHYRFRVNPVTNTIAAEFQVNHYAMPIFRLYVDALSFEDAWVHCCTTLDNMTFDLTFPVKKHAYINVVMTDDHYSQGMITLLKERYPHIDFKKELLSEKQAKAAQDPHSFYGLAELVTIDAGHYRTLMASTLAEQGCPETDIAEHLAILEEVLC